MSALPFNNPPCPECFNKDTHVELMVPVRYPEADEYTCRCGKCGLQYRATLERRVWLAQHPSQSVGLR
jgi:hypothetical protein